MSKVLMSIIGQFKANSACPLLTTVTVEIFGVLAKLFGSNN